MKVSGLPVNVQNYIINNQSDFYINGEFKLTICEEMVIDHFNFTRTGDSNDIVEIEDFEFKLYKFCVKMKFIEEEE